MTTSSPLSEPIEVAVPNSSKLFRMVRAIAIGFGVAGFALALVMYITQTPLIIAARGNVLAGAMTIFGAAILLLDLMLVGIKTERLAWSNWIIAILFVLGGVGLFLRGYQTESVNAQRLEQTKVNLEKIKAALENYQSGTVRSDK